MGEPQLALPLKDPTNQPTPLHPTRPTQPTPITSLRSLRLSGPDIHHSSLLNAPNTAINFSKPIPRTPSPPQGPHRQTPATNTTKPFAKPQHSKPPSSTRNVRTTTRPAKRIPPFPPANLRKVEVRVPSRPMLFRTRKAAFEKRSADPELVDPFVEEGGGGRGEGGKGAWTPMAPLGMSSGRSAGRPAPRGIASGKSASGRSAPKKNASGKSTSGKSASGRSAPGKTASGKSGSEKPSSGKSALEKLTFETTEKRPRGRTRKSAVQTAMPYPVAMIPARKTKDDKAAKGAKGVRGARVMKPVKKSRTSKAAKSVAARTGAASRMTETVVQSIEYD